MRTISRAAILAAILALLPLTFASAADVTNDVHSFAFSPSTFNLPLEQTVAWSNSDALVGGSEHTSTSNLVGLWDTGNITPQTTSGDQGPFPAGVFAFHCSIHPNMTGTITVPLEAQTSLGSIVVTWASGSVPDGFNEDVQVKKPGSTRFVKFRANQTGSQVSTTFTPSKHGKYKFRARLQNSVDGSHSPYSPVVTVFF